MSCNESCNKEVTQCKKNTNNCERNGGGVSNFVIVIVLYILLAIIIGSCLI